MKTNIQVISIFKNHEFVGNLNRTETGCELVIDKNFQLQHPDEKITYHITTEKNIYTYNGVGLPAYFAGLLPEGVRLNALIKKIKTSADDMFSLLAASAEYAVGDIHFQEQETDDQDKNAILDFKKIQSDIRNLRSTATTNLAGVQDKISADRISLPIRVKNKSYILKLSSNQFSDSIQNEMTCLEIAKACGLTVNKAKIIKDKNNIAALLIERFDRKWDANNQRWQLFHQEDACQFLNKYPADKYIISFQDIATGIKQFSISPEIDILKLLQLKAFSYLIGNGDLHAKNISLLNDQLSPCYDVLCTSIYGDDKMALQMDGKNQNLKRKNFIDFGKRYGISEQATVSMLDKLIQKFEKNNPKVFEIPAAKTKKKFLVQMFTQRMEQLS